MVLVKFRVWGNLRFLSHAETMRLFQRACARAGLEMQYSRGFNPRPKLSLPLPRSVGTETDDDLLCLRVRKDACNLNFVRERLSEQLPEGCEVLSVDIAETGTSIQPNEATYLLAVHEECLDELKAKIESVLASEKLVLQRQVDKYGKVRDINVRGFIESVKLEDGKIIVDCKISSAGSVRIDEILKLLELDVENLTAPIRRVSVRWQNN